MKKILSILCLICFSAIAGVSQTAAFTNVNVVPMDKERILENQTVLIKNGIIAEIGAKVKIPKDAQIIDGKEKYLIPGLADMHVHIFSEDELVWYIANGVTTVRNMWGFDSHLKMRRKIMSGELLGPNIFTAGAIIDGKPPQLRGSAVVELPREADQIVKSQKEAGYDFIKVYNRLTLSAYDAVIAAAKKYDIKVVGHIPGEVSLEHALEQKQYSIEHLYGYPEAAKFDNETATAKWEFRLDDKKIKKLAKKTRQAGTWNCPTLVVSRNLEFSPQEIEELLKRPEIGFLPKQLKRMFPKPDATEKVLAPEIRKLREVNRRKLVKALHDAKAMLLLGTDTGNPYVMPGFAVHEELQLLVEAGLTPFEALQTSTVNAAEFLGRSDFGTISVGKKADLVLVNGNPLKNVSNTAHIDGVLVQGKWLDVTI